MKTKTVKVALYKNIQFGYTVVSDVDTLDSSPELFRISNIVSVKFEIINSAGENDAMKAIKIKLAQDRLAVAQKDLDDLL